MMSRLKALWSKTTAQWIAQIAGITLLAGACGLVWLPLGVAVVALYLLVLANQ